MLQVAYRNVLLCENLHTMTSYKSKKLHTGTSFYS